MKITSSYKVKLFGPTKAIKNTVRIYREVLSYLIRVVDEKWEQIKPIYKKKKKLAQGTVEHMVHRTRFNEPCYDFDEQFPKLPSYLRRAAINAALGAVSSYYSNLENWERDGKQGKAPTLTIERNAMPTFYNEKMSECSDMLDGVSDNVGLKLHNGHDWVWMSIPCRHQDVKYIVKYWNGVKAKAPTLVKKHKHYYLCFAFVKRDNISYNISLPVRRAIFFQVLKKPYSAGFPAHSSFLSFGFKTRIFVGTFQS